MQILVVEDEQSMAKLLEQGLQEEGHSVVVVGDGLDGLAVARDEQFDVIVLDLMMPKMDGLSVAKYLRADGNHTPILMLTAKDGPRNIVEGLDTGADDYLTKPFSFDELLARLRAVTRRKGTNGTVELTASDLSLNPATCLVRRAGSLLNLTRTEYRLLELLLRRIDKVVTRDSIIQAVWGFDTDVESNTLDVFMSQLRRKVDPPGAERLIHTVRGMGYCLRAPA